MSLFNPEQLKQLTDAGVAGLSPLVSPLDAQRLDLTASPFLAVDCPNPHERDDAFQVKACADGGFLLRVAVADMSFLDPDSPEVHVALAIGENEYRGSNCTKEMFPPNIVQRLEMRGPERPALVYETRFDDNMVATPADVYPATVDILNLSFADAAAHFKRNGGSKSPYIRFESDFRESRGLPLSVPYSLGGEERNRTYGADLVQDCMVTTGLQLVPTAQDAGWPIPIRAFDTPGDVWSPTPGQDRRTYVLTDSFPEHKIPYARPTSPLRRGTSLVTGILVSQGLQGADQQALEAQAQHLYDLLANN